MKDLLTFLLQAANSGHQEIALEKIFLGNIITFHLKKNESLVKKNLVIIVISSREKS